MTTPESIRVFPNGVMTLSESGDTEKPHRLRWIARDGRTFSKDYGSLGYSQVMQQGPEHAAGLMDMAAGDKTHDLSALENGVLMLAAERCTDAAGFVDEEKVARFAKERGMAYSEARDLVARAVNGDAEHHGDDGYAMIGAYAKAHDLSFKDAVSELAAAGALDGGGASSVSADNMGRPAEAELDHAAVEAHAEKRNIPYVEAAAELAARSD